MSARHSQVALGIPVSNGPMAGLIAQLKREDAGLPDLLSLPIDAARAQFDAGAARWNRNLPEMAVARSIVIERSDAGPALAGNLRIPHAAKPGLIVYIHGGGWMFGSPETHERAIRYLARTTGIAVIAPRYRLAPEAPFPAGLLDVCAAISGIRSQHGRWNIDAGPFGISGDSAGANLAMSAMIDAWAKETALPDFAMLFYGVFDADFATQSYCMGDPDYGLTPARMKAYWDRYVPDVALRPNPLISPLKASETVLRALPPLYLNAAEIDPLRDDTLGLVARLEMLGRSDDACHLHRGVVHGFMQMTIALDEARKAFDLAADWLETKFYSHNQGRKM